MRSIKIIIETDKKFDLIVFTEVIEHLFTAPELVLYYLKSLLLENGVILYMTPNATSLYRRLKLLRGIDLYEKIRFNTENPGHFREYTKNEMIDIGKTSGLEVVDHIYLDFTPSENKSLSKSAFYHLLGNMWPAFMPYQVIVLRCDK